MLIEPTILLSGASTGLKGLNKKESTKIATQLLQLQQSYLRPITPSPPPPKSPFSVIFQVFVQNNLLVIPYSSTSLIPYNVFISYPIFIFHNKEHKTPNFFVFRIGKSRILCPLKILNPMLFVFYFQIKKYFYHLFQQVQFGLY